MQVFNWCPTPRAVAGWLAAMLVAVTGVGIMAAWLGQGSARAVASSGPAETGAPSDPQQEKQVTETATFAAGCFWGVQVAFDRLPGVVSTSVGFMGGEDADVTYKEVCTTDTGHAEVVHVEFDPAKVSYEELLHAFWHAHDPTTLNRQGPDIGEQYRSAIFYHSDAQKAAAEKSMAAMQASAEFREVFGDRKIVTEIAEAGPYVAAEDYHQKYFEKRGMAASCHRGW